MKYFKKLLSLFNNYVIARLLNRPSTAQFWYLPEPPVLLSSGDLETYQAATVSPNYLIDYRAKLKYSLENQDNIIVLPYQDPVGQQVNPEAAFQYALGLHDQFDATQDPLLHAQFLKYANYFLEKQTANGLWHYDFDWFASKAPWSSALAQARGASVMLRAWLHTKEDKFKHAAKNALSQFLIPISQGGFLHTFVPENCAYFEEYPETPTGVINGFMASLMCIWEVRYWLKEPWLDELWCLGIDSLHKMLPYYSNGWWSLYDRDIQTPFENVNSPRYHLLEINYLKILSLLAESVLLKKEYEKRMRQYNNKWYRLKALVMKLIRKLLYK